MTMLPLIGKKPNFVDQPIESTREETSRILKENFNIKSPPDFSSLINTEGGVKRNFLTSRRSKSILARKLFINRDHDNAREALAN